MEKWETLVNRFWTYFKRMFNIQIQENQGCLLFSSAISGLIYTYSNPPIVKEIQLPTMQEIEQLRLVI